MIGFLLIRATLFASKYCMSEFPLGVARAPLYTDVTLREYFPLVPIFPLWSVGIFHKVKDRLRRLIGEVPTILRYMYAALRQEREVLCLFACKGKHFLSMKPTFIATKSSRISNPVVSCRKLADFLSLLPLFLCRAPSF